MAEFRAVHLESPMTSGINYRTCPKCQATLAGNARFCTACLLQTGLDLLGEESDGADIATGFPSEPALTEFGDYDLLQEIGRGGQGVVYRAHQKSLNRTVALKIVGLGQWSSTPQLKRFRQEAEAAASLEHPQIVPIYEIGEHDRSCYFSMKFVEGGQLDAVLEGKPMLPRRAAELLVKIARTVQFAHEHGILHRDIKPGNILLDKKGEPHLTDFGLARLLEYESTMTNSRDVLGTPSYIAPEQAAGGTKNLTAAADVYALGAVFYHTLTGQPPFIGSTPYETVRMVLEREPKNPRLVNPKIDFDLSTICLKCLEKDPKQRYETAGALADDVERWLRHEPIKARRSGLVSRGIKWLQRNPTTAVAAASLAALLVLGGIVIWRTYLTHPQSVSGIAVLPFENLSNDKGNAYFAEGIQDEILTRLSEIRGLRVISRTSTERYKSHPSNLREIARQLGIANILEGSVQKAAEGVRINVQLIDAQTDAHLWAKTYDRDMKNVFAVQGEVAQEIAAALKLKFQPSPNEIDRAASEDPEAYDLFLRAQYAQREWFRGTGEVEEALKFLRAAIARDPKFARAYAFLAIIESQRADVEIIDTALANDARSNAQKALALQPDLPDAIRAMGLVYLRIDCDYRRALDYLSRAHETQATSDAYLIPMGLAQAALGRWNEALDTFQEAVVVNPGSSHPLNVLGVFAARMRQYSRAQDAFHRALAIDPNDWTSLADQADLWLAQGKTENIHNLFATMQKGTPLSVSEEQWRAAFLSRDYSGALQLAREWNGGYPGEKELFIGRSLAALGDRAAAMQVLEQAQTKNHSFLAGHPDSPDLHQRAARIFAARGDKTSAVFEAERAVALRPLSKDADGGVSPLNTLAEVYAAFGDADKAIPLLQQLRAAEGTGLLITPGLLQIDPVWDPLRSDPRFQKLVTELAPNETTIAVLPFENLTAENGEAFFADGVQDEILTHLARIADLKVISRTSVMQYKSGVARNLRKIAEELGVAHVLEGSVQRAANKIRVNAQLIDARTDTHLWGQTYDGDLSDIFAIESKIAETVAGELQARLSPAEKSALEQRPTNDIAAFDVYSRAKTLILSVGSAVGGNAENDLRQAIELLKNAIWRDPTFHAAFCQLAFAHDQLYGFHGDHTSERLNAAEEALRSATQLQPDSAETHLARANHLFWALHDYKEARAELQIAARDLPNDSRIPQLMGLIVRRQDTAKYGEGLRLLEQALTLDPRNVILLQQIAGSREGLREYEREAEVYDRALQIKPDDLNSNLFRTLVDFYGRADPEPMCRFVERVNIPAPLPEVADNWFWCSLARRDWAAADQALAALGDNPCWANGALQMSRQFGQGLRARAMHDDARAREIFTAARAAQEKIVQQQNDYGPPLCVLGLIDAALGNKEAALAEGRHAMELLPKEKDAFNGEILISYFAVIAAWADEKDLAIDQLNAALPLPGAGVITSYGVLKLMPFWDPLRGDPRFEKIVESLAPK